MIPNTAARNIQSSGVTSSGEFGISLVDSAFIMNILRDTLYSDKILAPLREYSANAWDAHRDAGKKDVPIKVTIPTKVDPTLTIQDFGSGLSEEDMFKVYTQYGRSTKRNSQDAVGMLGIGSKSAFAYSDSFTISSRHGGMCRTYVAVLDASKKGTLNLLNEEEIPCPCGGDHVASMALPTCPPSETGITIQIPVKPTDIWEFNQKAVQLFRHFIPRPDINITLPVAPPDEHKLTSGVLHDTNSNENGWVAVMGCVPYHVNLDQLEGAHNPDGGIGPHLKELSGILYFDIGDIHVSASREELEYNLETKTALIKKLNELIEEYVTHAISVLENNQGITIWEKRVRVQVLNRLNLPVPKKYKDLLRDEIPYKGDSKTFSLQHNTGQPVATIAVTTETRLLLRDDLRAIKGFHDIKRYDYIVKKEDEAEWDDVRDELTKVAAKLEFTGIPVIKLSTLNWIAPPVYTPTPKVYNNKHRVTAFRLQPEETFGPPWSDYWEVVKRVPTKEDVFVVLDGFKTRKHNFDIYHLYRGDRKQLEALGRKMPEIYGYKSTKRKPKPVEQCVGVHYPEWRAKMTNELLQDPKIQKMLAVYEAIEIVPQEYHAKSGAYTVALDLLGVKHKITQLLKAQLEAKKTYSKYAGDTKSALAGLYERTKTSTAFKSKQAKIVIYEKYPLLAACGLSELWGRHSVHWGEYVNLIDKIKPKNLTPGVLEDEPEENDDD